MNSRKTLKANKSKMSLISLINVSLATIDDASYHLELNNDSLEKWNDQG